MSEQFIKQHTVVLCRSLAEFVYTIDEYRQAGWLFDPDMPPVEFAFQYECGMIREVTEEQIEQENKPSRADILAKARAAKAAKARETASV
jgi:hypothetical protein